MVRQRAHLPALLALGLGATVLLAACSSETSEGAEPDAGTPATTMTPAEDEGPDPLPPADPAITREALEHHVRFLASDELLGRRPASAELARVRDYLVRALTRAGVRPAGDDGTYLQRVHIARWHHTKAPEFILTLVDGTELYAVHGQDFDVHLEGFGAPESHGPLTLRTVLGPDDLPDEVPEDEAIWVRGAEGREVEGWLAAKGYRVRDWPLQIHARSPLPGVEKGPPPAPIVFDDPALDPGNWLRLRGELRGVFTSGQVAKVDLRFFTTKEELEDYNVVGIIDGVSAQSARETVVLSAHVDGNGVRDGYVPDRPQGQDYILNGADSNASGVATLLEVAEAIAAAGPQPRAVVILFTTLGTESNMGATWYVEHPVVPLTHTILNLHFDMLGRPDERFGKPGRFWVAGSKYTNLQQAWFVLDLQAAEDMRPRYGYYRNRGSGVFVARNIPAHTLTSYGDHGDLYSFRDEADKLDYEHLTAVSQACLDAAMGVIDRTIDPAWSR